MRTSRTTRRNRINQKGPSKEDNIISTKKENNNQSFNSNNENNDDYIEEEDEFEEFLDNLKDFKPDEDIVTSQKEITIKEENYVKVPYSSLVKKSIREIITEYKDRKYIAPITEEKEIKKKDENKVNIVKEYNEVIKLVELKNGKITQIFGEKYKEYIRYSKSEEKDEYTLEQLHLNALLESQEIYSKKVLDEILETSRDEDGNIPTFDKNEKMYNDLVEIANNRSKIIFESFIKPIQERIEKIAGEYNVENNEKVIALKNEIEEIKNQINEHDRQVEALIDEDKKKWLSEDESRKIEDYDVNKMKDYIKLSNERAKLEQSLTNKEKEEEQARDELIVSLIKENEIKKKEKLEKVKDEKEENKDDKDNELVEEEEEEKENENSDDDKEGGKVKENKKEELKTKKKEEDDKDVDFNSPIDEAIIKPRKLEEKNKDGIIINKKLKQKMQNVLNIIKKDLENEKLEMKHEPFTILYDNGKFQEIEKEKKTLVVKLILENFREGIDDDILALEVAIIFQIITGMVLKEKTFYTDYGNGSKSIKNFDKSRLTKIYNNTLECLGTARNLIFLSVSNFIRFNHHFPSNKCKILYKFFVGTSDELKSKFFSNDDGSLSIKDIFWETIYPACKCCHERLYYFLYIKKDVFNILNEKLLCYKFNFDITSLDKLVNIRKEPITNGYLNLDLVKYMMESFHRHKLMTLFSDTQLVSLTGLMMLRKKLLNDPFLYHDSNKHFKLKVSQLDIREFDGWISMYFSNISGLLYQFCINSRGSVKNSKTYQKFADEVTDQDQSIMDVYNTVAIGSIINTAEFIEKIKNIRKFESEIPKDMRDLSEKNESIYQSIIA